MSVTCFQLINHTMAKKLKLRHQTSRKTCCRSLWSSPHLCASYRPTTAHLKTLRVLKEIRKNKNTAILKPDKGNGVVVLDRWDYDQGILKIINDTLNSGSLRKIPLYLEKGDCNVSSENWRKMAILITYSVREHLSEGLPTNKNLWPP